jgi:hypothetical protein
MLAYLFASGVTLFAVGYALVWFGEHVLDEPELDATRKFREQPIGGVGAIAVAAGVICLFAFFLALVWAFAISVNKL